MTSTTRTDTERCMILELPVEVRTIIYKLVRGRSSRFSNGELLVKASTSPLRRCSPTPPPTLALTQINQKIRREALPIISRGVWISIYTGTEADRIAARDWLAVAYEEMINNVDGYVFAPCNRCSENLLVPIDRADEFEVGELGHCGYIPRTWKEKFVEGLVKKVKALPKTHNGRRNVTKEAVEVLPSLKGAS